MFCVEFKFDLIKIFHIFNICGRKQSKQVVNTINCFELLPVELQLKIFELVNDVLLISQVCKAWGEISDKYICPLILKDCENYLGVQRTALIYHDFYVRTTKNPEKLTTKEKLILLFQIQTKKLLILLAEKDKERSFLHRPLNLIEFKHIDHLLQTTKVKWIFKGVMEYEAGLFRDGLL